MNVKWLAFLKFPEEQDSAVPVAPEAAKNDMLILENSTTNNSHV